MKICRLCEEPLSLDAFGTNKNQPDGKHWACRPCWTNYVQNRRQAKGVKPMQPFLVRLWSNILHCGHEDFCPYCCWPWQKALDADGYGHISITYNGHNRSWPVANIVYEVFHGIRIPDGFCACHYCDFAACSNPLHIWPGTRVENRFDCVAKGRHAKGLSNGHYTKPEAFPRGEQHCRAKLTEQDVREIREAHRQGIPIHRLAGFFHVSDTHILSIVKYKTWKHV